MATLTVDDNDPRIQYAGGLWEVLQGSSQQYDSTVHSTWDFNATATFSFNGLSYRLNAAHTQTELTIFSRRWCQGVRDHTQREGNEYGGL
jgi:hypothetical protein